MRKERILVIAKQPVRDWLHSSLKDAGFEVNSSADGYRAVLALFKPPRPNLVISDLTLSDGDGLNFLQAVREVDALLPVIVMTDGEELDQVIEAMERGAYECIEKPIELSCLMGMIARALKIEDLPLGTYDRPGGMVAQDLGNIVVGRSGAMVELRKKMEIAAAGRHNLLVQGEPGTGKRLICRTIHELGATKGHPFVAVDVPAIPEPLMEEVLFGRTNEPRSGQTKDRKGLLETAGAGSIFLSEISRLSPSMQGKLSKALCEREFRPVGGQASIPIKARIVGGTNANIREMVRAGSFSEELFYLIAVSLINVLR